jgi:flagellar basal body-associated protein FliL
MLFYFLQTKTVSYTDPLSLAIACVIALAGAVTALFFIQRKESRERAQDIKTIYESVIKEVNVNINNNTESIKNNNRLTDENSKLTKDLRDAVTRLPSEIRNILKDR